MNRNKIIATVLASVLAIGVVAALLGRTATTAYDQVQQGANEIMLASVPASVASNLAGAVMAYDTEQGGTLVPAELNDETLLELFEDAKATARAEYAKLEAGSAELMGAATTTLTYERTAPDTITISAADGSAQASVRLDATAEGDWTYAVEVCGRQNPCQPD